MTLKNLLILFAFASLALTSCSKTADDVIKKNIEARGGENNIKNIQSAVIDAKITSMGIDIPVKIYIQEPGRMRVDMNLMGQNIITAYDGNSGWVASADRVEKIPDDKLGQIKDQMKSQFNFFQTQLFDYKQKGLTVELMGKDKVDGKEAYKIKVKDKDSTENIFYIDADNYIDFKIDSKANMSGKPSTAEIYFKNYKKVNNIMVPHEIEVKSQGKTQAKVSYEKVSINQPIDKSLFKMPTI